LRSGIFQQVKGLQDSIILVVPLLVAIMKHQVASFEEQFVNVSLFAGQLQHVCLCCTVPTNHPSHAIHVPNVGSLTAFRWDWILSWQDPSLCAEVGWLTRL